MTLFELHQDGCSIREISRISGLSRNTLRRYVRDGLHRNEAAARFRPSKLDPFKEEVKKLVEESLYCAPAILERLIKSGYQGKETIPRDYIRSIKPPTLKAPSQR